MTKRTELVIDLVLAGLLLAYIASLNPTSFVYLKNQYRALRYWLWLNGKYPAWLQEALQVRGKL